MAGRVREGSVPGPRSQHRRSGKGIFWLLALAVVAIAYISSNEGGPSDFSPTISNDIASYCRNKPGEATAGLQSWVANGTVKRFSPTRIDVADAKWAAITHDAKVIIALYGYCNAIAGKSSDRAHVSIRGWRDGQQKAFIIDGNYHD